LPTPARRLVVPAAILALLLAAGTAPASRFDVEFDDSAAALVTVAFERGAMNTRLADDIVRSDGYGLLFRHMAAGTGRTAEQIGQDFRLALGAALAGEPDPGFSLQGVRDRTELYRDTLREFLRISGGMRWRITSRLNEFLPPRSDFRSTAYLIIGGNVSGLAFGDVDDIALRMDDFVPKGDDDRLDADRLASVLTHELFHVGFRAAGGLPPRPAGRDAAWAALVEQYGSEVIGEVWRATGDRRWNGADMAIRLEAWVQSPARDPEAFNRYIAMLSRLQNEGTAVYVDAPLRDPGTTRRHAGEVERWMETIEADFDYFAHVTERLSRGAGAVEIDRLATRGFENNGPLYRVGFRIAERIDGFSGRRPLLQTIEGGPLEFFATYLETHPYGPGQIDSRTSEEIEQIIREIRAVGAFDPEG